MTRTQAKSYKAKCQRESAEHLKSLGYESAIFKARYKGGICVLCGSTIRIDAEMARFQGALSHVICIDKAIRERDQCQACKGTFLVILQGQLTPCPDCG